jgi:hypothetical protein
MKVFASGRRRSIQSHLSIPSLTLDRFSVITSASEAIHCSANKAWIASSLSLLAMTRRDKRENRQAPAISRRIAPELCINVAPLRERAQGMPDARRVRSRTCRVVNTCVSHHGHAGNVRHSPRDSVTAYLALSPATGLSCRRHPRKCFRELDASVGASGPHAFAVRTPAPSSKRRLRPPHPAPTSVTIAIRPSCGCGMARYTPVIWVRRKPKYFCDGGWTGIGRFARQADFSRPARALRPRLFAIRNRFSFSCIQIATTPAGLFWCA